MRGIHTASRREQLGTRLLWQHQLVDRIRGPSLRRRVEDMNRHGAVSDRPDVLRGTWRAIGVRYGTFDRARWDIELQSSGVAEDRLDRNTVDPDQGRHR